MNGTAPPGGTDSFAEAYLEMAKQGYRPAAPSDGFGHPSLSLEELRDRERLQREAVQYAVKFLREEDAGVFEIGCSDSRTSRALVYTIEAARCMCGGFPMMATTLLRMALDEVAEQRSV